MPNDRCVPTQTLTTRYRVSQTSLKLSSQWQPATLQRMQPYNLLNAMPRSSHSRLAVFKVINLQPSERDALAIAHYSLRRCLRDLLSRNAEIHVVNVARIHRQPPLVPLLRRMIVLSR